MKGFLMKRKLKLGVPPHKIEVYAIFSCNAALKDYDIYKKRVYIQHRISRLRPYQLIRRKTEEIEDFLLTQNAKLTWTRINKIGHSAAWIPKK